MKLIKYEGRNLHTSDDTLLWMRRHTNKLKPLTEKQARSMDYTHLALDNNTWIAKEYEPWLRVYLEYYIHSDGEDHPIDQEERFKLCYPFLKALHREGVPNMAWIEKMKPIRFWKPLSMKVFTRKTHPHYFKDSSKIKNTIANSNRWIVVSDSKVIIETMKALWGSALVIHTNVQSVVDRCNHLNITTLELPRDLASVPVFVDLADCKCLEQLNKDIYNWNDCLVIRSRR